MRSRLSSLTALALILAACSAPDPGVTSSRSQRASGEIFADDPTDTTPPREYQVIDGVVDFGERGPQHAEYDGYLTAALKDIQDYWATTFPEVYGSAWTPLGGGIHAAYPTRTAVMPACSRTAQNGTYEDVVGNAFYCILGDFMAYDDDGLLPRIVGDVGREGAAVVLAHEFGHAVQARADEWGQSGLLKEQQADCFAGAWVARVASGGSDVISFDDRSIRSGLIAMLQAKDPIDTSGIDPLATGDPHGTGFDRVGAFQDGFLGGAERCKTFFTENRIASLIDLPFQPDDPNGGNLPLVDDTGNGNDIVTLIPQALDEYWSAILTPYNLGFTPPTFTAFSGAGPFPTCAGIDPSAWPKHMIFCPGDDTIYWDQDYSAELSASTGDLSVGYLMSNAYSEAVQTALASRRTSETRALLDACLTGAWVAWTIPSDAQRTITLSAGDLDEAVQTAIILSDPTADANINGTAFEAVDAFRTGVLGGLEVCQTKIH